MTSVYIAPNTRGKKLVGGIPQVCDAQTRWLPEHGIDVVDSPERADVLAVHAAIWIPPKSTQRVVSHCHGLYWADDNWQTAWHHHVNKEVIESMRQAHVVTVPSKWVRDSVARGMQLEPIVIGHGIELDEWELQAPHGYIFWDKSRQDQVCDPRCVSVLAAAMPEMKFITTFGEPSQNVQVVGELPYIEHKELMQHALLYLASARETFGISILEALACGVPVVGWNWGGQADILTGETGWLSPVGDYSDLVRGIKHCVSHRGVMSSAARTLATKYQWKDVIGKYATLYEAVASQQARIKVSVIVSLYNLGRYLPDCINSVLQQDYKDVEIVIVDDCSTDDSYQVAQRWVSYKNVKIIKTPVNSNMPTVLNMGIEASSGEYVLPLDADNMLAPGALNTLVSQLDTRRELDIVYGKIRFVLEDGQTVDRNVAGDGISAWPPPIANLDQQMMHRNQIPSTALYRRRLFDQIGGYRHRCFRIGEDPDFWCRALLVGARAERVTDAPTLVYRMRDESRSHVQQEWQWESWYPNRPAQTSNTIRIVDKPLVSVIIPVGPGHGKQAIEDALDSVYAQTFPSWECIVVDDCNEIRWLPAWVKSYTTPKSGSGVSVARNIGIAAARGECFVLLDADDYLDVRALEKLYSAWKHAGAGGYVYCDWYKTSGEAVEISSHKCQDMLHHLYHPITCLYPIQARDYIKFNESMRVGEDWDYILQLLASGWCGTHLKEPLVYYRQESGNNRRGLLQDIDKIRTELNERYKDMGCGCSKGGGISVAATPQQMQERSGISGELILLRFVMPGVSKMTWTGQVTGHNYRFGTDDVAYVHRSDAEHFLNRPEFELANTSVLAG